MGEIINGGGEVGEKMWSWRGHGGGFSWKQVVVVFLVGKGRVKPGVDRGEILNMLGVWARVCSTWIWNCFGFVLSIEIKRTINAQSENQGAEIAISPSTSKGYLW